LSNSVFREATIEDIPQLRKLEQRLIEAERPYDLSIKDENVSYYDLEDLVSNPDSHLIVAEVASEIAGSGYAQIRTSNSFHIHDKHCYLGFIYLEQEHRGKAIGQSIVNLLKEWGKCKGLHHFHLDVYAENSSAIRAYEKGGFKPLSVKMELIE